MIQFLFEDKKAQDDICHALHRETLWEAISGAQVRYGDAQWGVEMGHLKEDTHTDARAGGREGS